MGTMSSWNNIHKWIVRYCDEEFPNLKELSKFQRAAPNQTLQPTSKGNTVFHFAVMGEHPAVLCHLINTLPKWMINQANHKGETPFHWASRAGYINNFMVLFQAGAFPALDVKGNSILHFAVEAGNAEIVNYILKHKIVDPNLKSSQGITPLGVAFKEGELRIIDILKQHGANSMELIRKYITTKESKVVQYLTKGSQQVDVHTENKQNPLHLAVKANNYRIAKVLLKVNESWRYEVDSRGNTPASLVNNAADKRLEQLLLG